MNVFVNMVEAAQSLAVASGAVEKAEAPEAKKKDTYEKAPQKGNFWDALMCSAGRGIYFWSDGTCEHGTGPTMHR
jgi:hypothetical protein